MPRPSISRRQVWGKLEMASLAVTEPLHRVRAPSPAHCSSLGYQPTTRPSSPHPSGVLWAACSPFLLPNDYWELHTVAASPIKLVWVASLESPSWRKSCQHYVNGDGQPHFLALTIASPPPICCLFASPSPIPFDVQAQSWVHHSIVALDLHQPPPLWPHSGFCGLFGSPSLNRGRSFMEPSSKKRKLAPKVDSSPTAQPQPRRLSRESVSLISNYFPLSDN